MPVSRRTRHRLRAASLAAVVVAATAIAVPIAPAASAAVGCKVTNLTTNTTTTTLQAAVNKAKAKQTLQVRGTCRGKTTIGKSLSIVGVATTATGKPTLTPVVGVASRVLVIGSGATVSITGLTVRGGDVTGLTPPESFGGGIYSEGRLTLRNVIVSGNEAYFGGGVATTGPMTLSGKTRLTDNAAYSGGGLAVIGEPSSLFTVTLRDSARIDHNDADNSGGGLLAVARVVLSGASQIDHNIAAVKGGGVAVTAGSLAIGGTSRIHHNTAAEGGGVNSSATGITLTTKSRITANTSNGDGGGLRVFKGTVTLKDQAQVDNNVAAGNGGGLWVLHAGMDMNGSSSVHDNIAKDAGGLLLAQDDPTESELAMNDTSAIYANDITESGGTAAVSIEGGLVMTDESVIRDHDSTHADRAVQVFWTVEDGSPSITMIGGSRIRDNDLAGSRGAVVLWNGCLSTAGSTGTSTRVVNNTPADVFTDPGCP